MPDDFVDLIGSLTNYIHNERIAAHNEAINMMLNEIRGWMNGQDIPHNGNTVPDLLHEIREALTPDKDR